MCHSNNKKKKSNVWVFQRHTYSQVVHSEINSVCSHSLISPPAAFLSEMYSAQIFFFLDYNEIQTFYHVSMVLCFWGSLIKCTVYINRSRSNDSKKSSQSIAIRSLLEVSCDFIVSPVWWKSFQLLHVFSLLKFNFSGTGIYILTPFSNS